jgi:hypothetical protein
VVTAGPVNKVGTVDAQLVTRHAQAMTTELGNTPGMDLWQTEKITAGGEAGLNGPDDHIANIGGEPSAQVPFLKLAANPDGSFQMTNSRNGFSKDYAAHK